MQQRYTVTARKTGAAYPNCAPDLGMGWEYILVFPGEPDRGFSTHKMAHAFARRLQDRIKPGAV